MKTIKFSTLLICCLATISLASCLGDDDDNSSRTLTKEEIAQCLMAVKGNYSGDMIYAARNEKNINDITDTLAVRWSITNDSTMTIANFPTASLAANVSDSTLRKALSAAPDQTITCRIGFIRTSPVQYLINPMTPSYTINYDGNDHNIQIAFYANSYNSFGSYDLTKKILQMQLIEAAIFVDGKQTTYLRTAVPFLFRTAVPFLFISANNQ